VGRKKSAESPWAGPFGEGRVVPPRLAVSDLGHGFFLPDSRIGLLANDSSVSACNGSPNPPLFIPSTTTKPIIMIIRFNSLSLLVFSKFSDSVFNPYTNHFLWFNHELTIS
jgi:hypothetical protein